VSRAALPSRPHRTERDIVAVAARYLESEGYRTYTDLDGTDYFDLVARRGGQVGLVEGKLADPRTVLAQALRRRAWGDWVAVALGSGTSAERLARRTDSSRSRPVGIWAIDADGLRVVRAATPWPTGAGDDPFRELRERFHRILDAVDRGEIPAGVRWTNLASELRRASGGRKFAEWRLDEVATEER
jgi:hypothetical protein